MKQHDSAKRIVENQAKPPQTNTQGQKQGTSVKQSELTLADGIGRPLPIHHGSVGISIISVLPKHYAEKARLNYLPLGALDLANEQKQSGESIERNPRETKPSGTGAGVEGDYQPPPRSPVRTGGR